MLPADRTHLIAQRVTHLWRRVFHRHAEECSQHVQPQQVGDGGAVGEAATLDPLHAWWRLFAQLGHQARLADARLANEGHDAAYAGVQALQGLPQRSELGLATHQRRFQPGDAP